MSGAWMKVTEVGSVNGLRFVSWLATTFGRGLSSVLLGPIAFYYALVGHRARRAMGSYYRRLGTPAGFFTKVRHLRVFAQCILDRVLLLRGDYSALVIEREGEEHLQRLRASRQGAILLGAHLGSFEAMRASAEVRDFEIYVVGYFKNAEMVNRVLDAAGNNQGPKLINLADSSPLNVALQIKEAIDAGCLVAVLADRTGHGQDTTVNFLGAEARLPTGPYALASTIGCPVFLTFGLYESPNRYRLICEPFAEKVELPRSERQKAIQGYAQRYADRLEHYCRLAPDNWFNFFEFWSESDVPVRHP
ncbi:MAG: lipid A biosynthesis acyltransferase [Polyangiaceae bacterium]|nr:lipid A biosynthesis acyltransferase [Polyangiaceae bacterium]